MIIPVRCFTCNHVLADKWDWYKEQCDQAEQTKTENNKHKKGNDEKPRQSQQLNRAELLDKLGLKRICCRRHFLGNVDLMDLV